MAMQISFSISECPTSTKAEDISQLNQDIASIDQQIELLRVKRISLLKKLNTVQSVTYTIPPEVLSYIMQMAINLESSAEERTTIPKNQLSSFVPLNLSAVSSHWRQVARSTPTIWTSLRLEFDSGFPVATFVKNKIPLLRYYFERAKSLHLSLVYYNCDSIAQHINPLMDVVACDNPSRIKSLTAPAEAVAAWQQAIYSQL